MQEIALVQNTRRNATVICSEDTEFLVVDKDLFLDNGLYTVNVDMFASIKSLPNLAGQWQCPLKMPLVQQIDMGRRTECPVTCRAFLN